MFAAVIHGRASLLGTRSGKNLAYPGRLDAYIAAVHYHNVPGYMSHLQLSSSLVILILTKFS